MADPYDPAREGAQMAFDGRMSYADYLRLDKVLSAQAPISDAHDEMLFIIQHQTSELWMKLMLSELDAARRIWPPDQLAPALKMLARVARIMEQLNSAWDVLRTMTPSDYTTFRGEKRLGQSSGFQSWQYRMIEFRLGNRNPAMMRPHVHVPAVQAALQEELAQPCLYQTVLGVGGADGPCAAQSSACTAPDTRTMLSRSAGALGQGLPRPCGALGALRVWPRNWLIWKITSAAGGLTMSPRSSV